MHRRSSQAERERLGAAAHKTRSSALSLNLVFRFWRQNGAQVLVNLSIYPVVGNLVHATVLILRGAGVRLWCRLGRSDAHRPSGVSSSSRLTFGMSNAGGTLSYHCGPEEHSLRRRCAFLGLSIFVSVAHTLAIFTFIAIGLSCQAVHFSFVPFRSVDELSPIYMKATWRRELFQVHDADGGLDRLRQTIVLFAAKPPVCCYGETDESGHSFAPIHRHMSNETQG